MCSMLFGISLMEGGGLRVQLPKRWLMKLWNEVKALPPGPGQILAVVLYIDDCTQIPIIEVTVPVENVVPQFPIGTALGLIAFAAAFGVFIYKGKILHI